MRSASRRAASALASWPAAWPPMPSATKHRTGSRRERSTDRGASISSAPARKSPTTIVSSFRSRTLPRWVQAVASSVNRPAASAKPHHRAGMAGEADLVVLRQAPGLPHVADRRAVEVRRGSFGSDGAPSGNPRRPERTPRAAGTRTCCRSTPGRGGRTPDPVRSPPFRPDPPRRPPIRMRGWHGDPPRPAPSSSPPRRHRPGPPRRRRPAAAAPLPRPVRSGPPAREGRRPRRPLREEAGRSSSPLP